MANTESRILVVEDNEPLLRAIQATLEAESYIVFTAADGEEALRVLEKAHPDLMVADIMMPNMDGYRLYEEIRARPEYVSIPFIFLTARAEREDMLTGKALGAEDYLTKPFDPEELLVAVRARLDRARAIREAAESEMEELKRQIVNVMGHELRTPLTYVLGYAELALADLSSPATDELRGFLLGIQRGAERLSDLVDDLLLLIRLDSGRAEAEFRMLARVQSDLRPLLKHTVRRYRERAAERGVRLQIEIGSDLPPVLMCEPLLADALGRLVDNAIKFSQDEGDQVTVTARAAGDWTEIAVSDQGVGLHPRHISHLFERFRQFEREEREQQGTGLGLHVAHQLVELHGGEITVESVPGEGSTFTIHLPAADIQTEIS
ncbi:MAG: response regulator [Anaerolineae bacterium]|jgi:signal transduction histidine kinase